MESAKLEWNEIWTQRRINVALVGCGGTGSEVFDGLMRLHNGLRCFGYAGLHVKAYDPDTVEQPNLARQRFWPNEVGHNKAIALCHRANINLGLRWEGIPRKFEENDLEGVDLLITCVDTFKSRREIAEAIQANPKAAHAKALWMDAGNGPEYGQIVLGNLYQGEGLCENVISKYPEILTTEDKDDRPSCSQAESLIRQGLCTNIKVANAGINLLWQLMRKRTLSSNALMIDCEEFCESAI